MKQKQSMRHIFNNKRAQKTVQVEEYPNYQFFHRKCGLLDLYKVSLQNLQLQIQMYNTSAQWFYVPLLNFNIFELPKPQVLSSVINFCNPCPQTQGTHQIEANQAQNHQQNKKAVVPQSEPSQQARPADEGVDKSKKRRYRKRRTNLKKNLKCRFKNCKVRFSSDMALMNHLRIKHGVRQRYNNKKR